jgi:hypothetical protein
VTYHVNDLVASSDGVAETTTAINNVNEAPSATRWHINVHLGSSDQIERTANRPSISRAHCAATSARRTHEPRYSAPCRQPPFLEEILNHRGGASQFSVHMSNIKFSEQIPPR